MAVHSKEIGTTVQIGDYIANEVPSGDINGTNTVYVLAHTPVDGTVQVTLNGMMQYPGSGKDYTISDKTITFAKPPRINSEILVHYLRV